MKKRFAIYLEKSMCKELKEIAYNRSTKESMVPVAVVVREILEDGVKRIGKKLTKKSMNEGG